jgi:ferritin-like metal-binding protein YciE
VREQDFDPETMDACLIAGGQRVEHYEMAAYGTLVAWAKAMGHSEAADLLEEILEEEKAADEKLTELADGGINQAAADDGRDGEDNAGEDEEATPKPVRKTKSAPKAVARSRR